MKDLSHWMRSVAPAGLACAALLAMSSPARGQVPEIKKPSPLQTYEGREEGETIMIDIDKSEFGDKGLPFDVAFKLEGPLPGRFGPGDRLDARFVEFNRVPDCESFFSRFTVARKELSDLNETDFIPVRQTRRPDSAIATSGFRQARIFDAATRQTIVSSMVAVGAETKTTTTETKTEQSSRFVVDFPPLKPNHYYCFQFISRKKLSDKELEDLQKAFVEVVDNELRKDKYERISPVTGKREFVVSTADYEKLRDTLGALIESKLATREQVVLAPQGSFFDVGTSLDGITAPYREDFEDIAKKTVDTRLGAIDTYEKQLDQALDLLKQFGETTVGDQTVRQKLSDLPNAGLLDLSKKQLQEQIEGVAEDQAAATDLEEVWGETAEDSPIKDRIGRIKALADSLRGLIAAAEAQGITLEQRATRVRVRGQTDTQTETQTEPQTPITRKLEASDIVENLDNAVANLGELQRILRERSQAIADWVGEILVEEQKSLVVGANTIAKYDTRAVWYMSVDLGSGLSWDTEDLFTYVGWNVYFRPVNKKSHLSWGGRPFGLGAEFMRRFSITLGVVQSGFEEGGANDPTFRGVIGSKAAVLGAGLRVNDSLRLSVGGLVFENENPDPLINTTTLNWAPYVALSFDWNATATFAKLLTKK